MNDPMKNRANELLGEESFSFTSEILAEKEKFEYCVFDSHEGYINQNLEKYLKEGWVVAGDAQVRHVGSPTNATFIFMAMKRKKK